MDQSGDSWSRGKVSTWMKWLEKETGMEQVYGDASRAPRGLDPLCFLSLDALKPLYSCSNTHFSHELIRESFSSLNQKTTD